MERDSSPRIERLSWGRIEVQTFGRFKDARLFPGGAEEWDWRVTGTAHSPGIQPADVESLLLHGATAVVLSRGMLGRLRVRDETLEVLRVRGVDAHVRRTEEAVRIYNELRELEPVAGLFHSTC